MPAATPTSWLLDGATGWRTDPLGTLGVTVGTTSGIRLGADPEGPLAPTSTDGSLGGLTLPLGMALDQGGTLYLLDPEVAPERRRILRFDATIGGFAELPTLGPAGPSDEDGGEVRVLRAPASLAIAGSNLYVVDRGPDEDGPGRLLVFAIDSLALLHLFGPPAIGPVDVAARGRQAYVLDRGRGRVWRHEVGTDALVLVVDQPGAGNRWTRLAVDRDHRLYLLDPGSAALEVFDPAGRPLPRPADPGDLRDRFDPPPIRLDHRGRFCLPAGLARPCDRQTPPAGPPPEAPLALCRPGTGGLVFDRSGRPATVEPAERPGPALYRTAGGWTSQALDSDLYRCQWHRVELRLAELPPGTQVVVSTYTDDRPRRPEEVAELTEDRWSTHHVAVGGGQGPPGKPTGRVEEFLVQSRQGQYLWLRLRLAGDGHATPAVGAIRVHFPRESYLDYLPAVYAANDESRWFLERFLSVFQTEWDAIEREIDQIERYFDPGAVPAGPHLDFLATWLALPLEGGWSDEQRRRLLAAAPGIYRHRGTPAAVRDHLRVYLENLTGLALDRTAYPVLVEGFRERSHLLLSTEGTAVVGQGAPLWSPSVVGRLQLDIFAREGEARLVSTRDPQRDLFHQYAHRFRVFVPAAWVRSSEDERMVRRALDAERPAHTAYDLCLVEPRLRVGVQSTVGLDTIVAATPVARLACSHPTNPAPAPSLPARHRLGYDTVLVCSSTGPGGPRVGISTTLT